MFFNRPFFVILPNYRMINYDYNMFNLSSGVTCNWCIQLDAPQSLALTLLSSVKITHFLVAIVNTNNGLR